MTNSLSDILTTQIQWSFCSKSIIIFYFLCGKFLAAQVGSYISSIPTGVSAHSSSVVHSAAPVVSPIVTPIQKTVIAAPLVSAPLIKTIAAPAYAYNAAPYAYNAYPNLW